MDNLDGVPHVRYKDVAEMSQKYFVFRFLREGQRGVREAFVQEEKILQTPTKLLGRTPPRWQTVLWTLRCKELRDGDSAKGLVNRKRVG